MYLTKAEEAMASGKQGPGIKRCMDILIKLGDAFGAERMVKISSAHTMPKEPPELLDEMTEGVERAATFTTLHSLMSSFDPKCWEQMGIPEDFAERELSDLRQRMDIYRRVGFYQTYTCLPMLVGNLPRFGDYVSWIGSGAQLLVNSLIGARTNRDGTVVNLASAITGRAPYMGLLLDQNRYAEVVVELNGLDPFQLTHVDFGAIGYYLGAKAENRNIVIKGLPRDLDFDQVKYLMAPLSVSGSVSICHVVGMTPEAPTLERALGNRKPSEIITVGKGEIKRTKGLYTGDDHIDMALFGCPHCTVLELKTLASLLDGKKIGSNQRLWIGMPYQHYYLAKNMGYTDVIENAGGVISSSCMATIPDSPIPEDVKVVATNSFKAAHYISRLTRGRVTVCIEDMDICIKAITA
jgi:cis-L-3-hydroxyproline dehydratase